MTNDNDKYESYTHLPSFHSNKRKLHNLAGLSRMIKHENQFIITVVTTTVMAATIY